MSIIRFSTEDIPVEQRSALFFDEVSKRFTAADTQRITADAGPPQLRMAMCAGSHLEMSSFYLAGVQTIRGSDRIRDGDDGFTLWISHSRALRSEHNGRRVEISAGQALLVSHRSASQRWWCGNHASLLSVPRQAIPGGDLPDAVCGQAIAARRPLLKLLRAYCRSVWQDSMRQGSMPAEAERNLSLLVARLASAIGGASGDATRAALAAARLAAMREMIARRAAELDLDMRAVAAAVGLSERSGHLVLAAGGLTFSACLAAARLDRVQARLEAGDPGRIIDIALDAGFGDVAHFNRLFRARFGMTPTEMRAMATRPG